MNKDVFTGYADLTPIVAKNGMGRDIWTVPPDNITRMLKVRQFACSNHSEMANPTDL
jgi:hypothetical protein